METESQSRYCQDSLTLSPRRLRAPHLPAQERTQVRIDKEHKMHEKDENGEYLHILYSLEIASLPLLWWQFE